VPLNVRKFFLNVKEGDHWLDQGFCERIELELNFKKCNWRGRAVWTEFLCLRIGPISFIL